MPTSDHQDEIVDEICDMIEQIIDTRGKRGNHIVMGYWNSVIDEGWYGNEVWNFGLGIRNDKKKQTSWLLL